MSSAAPQWFNSSYSDNEGPLCLEVAIAWRKSSPKAVRVRDSKNPETGPTLQIGTAAWAAFLAATA